jgi:seryl-tRNA synthetase
METRKEKVEKARMAVYEMMDWDKTPQGAKYWSDVISSLDEITEELDSAKKQEKLDQEDMDRILEALDLIRESFVWSNSPQGHDYWSDVADNLAQIVKDQKKNNKKKDHCDCGYCEDD